MNNHIFEHQQLIKSQIADTYLQKGGEGSKGGKVIGHTKSGKPIYAHNGFNASHANFSHADHTEAAATNRNVAAQHRTKAKSAPNAAQRQQHLAAASNHNQFANEHEEQAKKKGASEESVSKGEEDTDDFMTPLEHQEILKAQIAESFEKGGKAAVIGEKRVFGGKDYIKTAKGWRPVGKNGGKVKDAHDAIHGKKHSFEEVLANPEGKEIVEGIEGLDSKRADHKPLYEDYKKQLKDKFGYDYKDDSWDSSKEGGEKKGDVPYGSDMSDELLADRLKFHQGKEKESRASGKSSSQHSSKARDLEKEWSKRNDALKKKATTPTKSDIMKMFPESLKKLSNVKGSLSGKPGVFNSFRISYMGDIVADFSYDEKTPSGMGRSSRANEIRQEHVKIG